MAPGLKIRQEKIEEVYDVKEELGRGQFAVVKKCISKNTREQVAAKFVKVKKTKASRNGLSREMIEREAGILSTLAHEKVLKLHDVFDLGIEMCLVLELLSGGELFDKISEQEFLTEAEAGCYMKQVLEGIAYLHQKYIVHLDIKPENIVLKDKQKSDIKLVDFGLAQVIKPGDEVREMMGTPEFVAPEIVNFDCIGLYTDMWAIGVLAYILLSGCSPFLGDDNQETYANIVAIDYHFDEEYFDTISEDAKLFVEELLKKSTNKRNTAQDCLDHPWIRSMASPRSRLESSVIQTKRFKAFQARRRWQQSFQKMKAITRFSRFLKIRASSAEEPPTNDDELTTLLSPLSPQYSDTAFFQCSASLFCEPITKEAVERTRNYLKNISDNHKFRRKIKLYVEADSEQNNSSSDCSFVACDSEEDSELENSVIVDHADGQLNRGTLEIWTQKKSLFNRREKIRKIRKYQKEEKILYNSSFLRSLEMLHQFEKSDEEETPTSQLSHVTTSTPVQTKNIISVNYKTKHVTDNSSPLLLNCEVVEIFDTYEKVKVQCTEESGPVETEIIDHMDITNIYENIHLEDHGIENGIVSHDQHLLRSNSDIRSRLSSSSSIVRGTSMSSEHSFRTSFTADNNNDTFTSKWESNSAIAEEFSKTDVQAALDQVHLFEDEYVIIDYENNRIFCRDSKSSSLFLFVQ